MNVTHDPDVCMTKDVLEQIPGLTYRVLDYFLRTGAVRLEAEMCPGSGTPRTFTKREMRALRRLWKRYDAARTELAAIRSGEVWAEELTGR